MLPYGGGLLHGFDSDQAGGDVQIRKPKTNLHTKQGSLSEVGELRTRLFATERRLQVVSKEETYGRFICDVGNHRN
jgi:hypothetical protein